MAKAKKTSKVDEKKEQDKNMSAFLIDLEGMAVKGRAIAFKLVKDVLSAKDIDLSAVMFSRYCLERVPARYVPELVKLFGRKDGEDLARQIVTRFSESLLDKSLSLAPGVEKMIKAASDKGIRIGMLSGLPKQALAGVVGNLGLADAVKATVSYSEDEKGYPPADAWLRLAKAVAVKPTRCVAFAGSARAGSTALAAHMRCVAVPDEYTSFQDFGGCDLLVEKADAGVVTDIVETMAGQ